MPDCDEMLELISAKLDGMISAEQEAVLEDHLAVCPACRALQADLEALHAALEKTAAQPVPPPPDLLEGVLAQIHAEQQIKPAPKHRTHPWRSWAAMAAVFAVVVAGAAGIKFFRSGSGIGASAGSSGGAAPPQASSEQITGMVAAAAPDAGAPPVETASIQLTEKSADTAEQKSASNDELSTAEADMFTGKADPIYPPASPYLPAGSAAPPLSSVLPQTAFRSGTTPGEGGVITYSEEDTPPEETLYCGILTLTWSDTLDLSSLDGLLYIQADGIRSYPVSASEFEALVQIYAENPDASLNREGDGVDPSADRGLLVITGAPDLGEDASPASPSP